MKISTWAKLILFTGFVAALTSAVTVKAGISHVVIMKSLSYEPKSLEIAVGDSVEWKNTSYTEHSATSNNAGEFETGMIAPRRASKQMTFSKAGTFEYHCSVHGKTMSGIITVK